MPHVLQALAGALGVDEARLALERCLAGPPDSGRVGALVELLPRVPQPARSAALPVVLEDLRRLEGFGLDPSLRLATLLPPAERVAVLEVAIEAAFAKLAYGAADDVAWPEARQLPAAARHAGRGRCATRSSRACSRQRSTKRAVCRSGDAGARL